jgi:glycosyltransferase involved in cell wall biosynthesis
MISNEPLISIIIPFLNPGSWLAEAIESVIDQTYPNWELILVDDGSVEHDTDLAKLYAMSSSGRITYMEHDGHLNRGLTASRNAGIALSNGRFVAFLDADDCWLPHKLAKQLGIFKQFPEVQMICEASIFWYSWKLSDEKDYVQEIGVEEGVYQPPQLMKQLYPLGEGQPPCPSGIMITKDALLRAGGFETAFSGIYQLYEDQAFLSKVYAREIVYISGKANNKYRKRDDSMSSAAGDESLYKEVRLFYLDWLERYFLQSSSTSPVVEELINAFRRKLHA